MSNIKNMIKLPQISIAISSDGLYLGTVYTEYRINADYAELPKSLIEAVVSAEDKRFFYHKGFDFIALLRAIWKNLKNFSVIQGGSTITQQLARIAIICSQRRTIKRKLLEILTAIRIERISAKEEILEAYLNAVYFGKNIYGIKTASLAYLDKNVSNLNLNESAYLAGLIRAPNRYLTQNHEIGNNRKNKVLELMYKNKLISKEVLIKNKSKNIIPSHFLKSNAYNYLISNGHYLDYVKKYLLKNHPDLFPCRQMIIRTALDKKCQTAIDRAIEDMDSNNKLKAICCLIIDKNDGRVKALRNALDKKHRCFNIVINGYLQPGSTIKPFILAEALNQGFSLESKFESKKVCIDIAGGKRWEVRNYNEIYRGRISLAEALIHSDNTVFAQLIMQLDIKKLQELLMKVGIDVGIPTPSLATGAINKGVSPMQIAAAYTVFSNGGYYFSPLPVLEASSINGDKLLESRVIPHYVLEKSTANEIDDVLRRVVLEGTGKLDNFAITNLRAKTGTTMTDAWYVSYDNEYHILTWVGEESEGDYNHSRLVCNPYSEASKISREEEAIKPASFFDDRKLEKGITAKQLAKRIWEYLKTKGSLGNFYGVAKGIERLDYNQIIELESYFMPWGEYGQVCH